jgi:hypothetical protein
MSNLIVLATMGRLCYTASEARHVFCTEESLGSILGVARRRSAVDPETLLLLKFSAIVLVVPVAVLLGHRWQGGAIIVSGGASLAAAIIFWILLGGTSAFGSVGSVNPVVASLLEIAGVVLLLAAWTLSINGAATSRSWLWVFLLVIVGYISIATQVIAVAEPAACFPGIAHPYSVVYTLLCSDNNPYLPLLFTLAHILGPAVVLMHGLMAVRARADATQPAVAISAGRRGPPPGLYISPINSAVPEEDTEPNVH